MRTITNPILTGFHPDPSILRVGEDYYISTSTFEWFPGVRIYHSKDLVHWTFVTSPLTRVSQLDMKGNMNSGGIWAPCLSYDDGIFYLIYTDVKSWHGAFKDTHNYLVTATDITGPWSDPIYLNSSGFDPSLFHDDDGRKWLLNMLWDFRIENHSFAGIVLQEYSAAEQRLVGPVKNIFKGTDIQLTEGPHLYKRHGYYYLLTAEGGTEYEHAATVARSRQIDGPYEVDPEYPLLTSAGQPELVLQKAGHGSLVETHTGEWYIAHLCGRPVKDHFCTLGRETALQRLVWTDDLWPRLAGGGNAPAVTVQAPAIEPHPFEKDQAESFVDHFDEPQLRPEWNTLRIPPDSSWLSLTERPGYLRLKGMESMSSVHQQSLVARRQESFHIEAETVLEFEPEHFQQMAGLILYYDTEDYAYLRITQHEEQGKCIGIIHSKVGEYNELLDQDIPLPEGEACGLRAVVNREWLQFSYRTGSHKDDHPHQEDENTNQEGENTKESKKTKWQKIGPPIDISHLSDDAAGSVRFTGTFIGLCVQDLSGTRKQAEGTAS
jgi:xylan 1,4-beta-xylosidase